MLTALLSTQVTLYNSTNTLLTYVLIYLRTYLLTYLLITYLVTHLYMYLTHLLKHWRTYALTYVLSYIFTYIFTYLCTYVLIYLCTYLLMYLLTYVLTYLLMYLLTYLLTQCSTVLLEKLTGSQLAMKFPTFYGTQRFITAFTRARHLSLSWARSIQSITPHPTSWRSILILSSHLRLSKTDLFLYMTQYNELYR
jgi:hypothetical protein